MSSTWIEMLMAYAGISCLIISFLATRRIHRTRVATVGKLERFKERLETVTNYNKLAAVRIGDAKANIVELETELKGLEDSQSQIQSRINEVKTATPSAIYVFDRVDNRKDKLFDFVVEATAEENDWPGPRQYIVAAPTIGQAAERVRDRFPSFSGFRISEGAERSRF